MWIFFVNFIVIRMNVIFFLKLKKFDSKSMYSQYEETVTERKSSSTERKSFGIERIHSVQLSTPWTQTKTDKQL